MSNLNNSIRSTNGNSRGSSAASPVRSTSQLARKASALEKELQKRLGSSASSPSQARPRQGVPRTLERKTNAPPPPSSSSSTQEKSNPSHSSPPRRLSAFDRLYQTPTGKTSQSPNSILRSPSSQELRSRPSSLSSANRQKRNDLTPRQPPSERNSANSQSNLNTPTPLSRRKSTSGEERKPAWNSVSRKNSTDSPQSSFARRNSYNMSLKNNIANSKASGTNNSRRPSITNSRPSSSVSSYVSDTSSVRSSRRPTNTSESRMPARGNAVRVHPVDKPLVLGTYSTYE